MRFISMIKSDESNPAGPPPPELYAAMETLAKEQMANGTLVELGGLLPSSEGAVVSLVGGTISVVDGPFTEAKELVGGYAILDVRSREEAVELTRRMMQVHLDNFPGWEGHCEVRRLAE